MQRLSSAAVRGAWLLALAAVLWASSVAAQTGGASPGPGDPLAGTPAAPRRVTLIARTVHGSGAPTVDGWFSVTARLINNTTTTLKGYVELRSEVHYEDEPVTTRANFSLPPQGEVVLQLPTHGYAGMVPELSLHAYDEAGTQLDKIQLKDPLPHDPVLLDLTIPSRIITGVRDRPLAVSFEPGDSSGRMGGSYVPELSVSVAQRSAGELVLPNHASGYGSVSVVLAKSEQLAALKGDRLQALVNWVLSGGSLAIVVSRPEDLRTGPLPALVGGAAHQATVPESLRQPATFTVPHRTFSSTRRLVTRREIPTSDVANTLKVYAGGNLLQSPWGTSATYGLGEVHLLAFDATRGPDVDDPWVQLKMLDLVQHSWDRRAHQALPHGMRALDSGTTDGVRRQLDPNERARWAIIVAALLLLAYAVLAGPVSFYRAARKGKPLRALLHLPLWALGTILLIVVLGAVARGVSGRARHLTLIEAGAGMTRASVTRYRGFYTSSAEDLDISTFEYGNVLDVATRTNSLKRSLIVDRDHVRIEGLRAKPWETMVVREDGVTDIGGGVSLVAVGSEIEIKNRLGRDLVAVVIKTPGKPATFFERIEDGGTRVASKGAALPAAVGLRTTRAGKKTIYTLQLSHFSKRLEAVSKGLGPAWDALRDAAPRTDWWPDDVPVLIGQMEGGEGRSSDSGLSIDEDRVLVRVIGLGGVR